MKKDLTKITIGFFGGHEFSVIVLEALREAGYTIAFVVTSLDKPKGRNLVLTPPPGKEWALKNNIPAIQPTNLASEGFKDTLKEYKCDVFIVMAYGRIIPDDILNIPKHKSLNIHPSLLPKFRGPCPIESAILTDEKETGVTIMRMDKEMDHGPIIAIEKVLVNPWPPKAQDLGYILVGKGAEILVELLPKYIAGKIKEIEQDHSKATYTKKIIKEDGLVNLSDDPYKIFLKIQAYHKWPTAYYFEREKRIKITEASFSGGKLLIEKVIPEGKGEMTYSNYLSSLRSQ
jgi:methionyl-tRNA formyltransferase